MLEGQQATVQSDIYSLGVLLYRLVAGSYPVQARTVREVRRAHERGERIAVQTARSDVPSKLARVIERAIDPRPERRYDSADALGADLATLKQRPTIVRLMHAAGAAVQAETASGTAGARRVPLSGRVLRSGRGRAAVLVLLIALAAAGTLTWRSVRSGSAPVALGAGGRPAIAIMPFDNLAGGQDTAWLSKGVPSMLLTGLAQTRGLEIVSGQRLNEVIRQMGASSLETLGSQ